MLRVVVVAYAVALDLLRLDTVRNPGWVVVAVVVMLGWTVLVTAAYAEPRRRGAVLLAADLAVTVALLLATPYVVGRGFAATLPGFWVMAVLLSWAVRLGWRGGLVAGVLLAGVDLALRAQISQTVYNNLFLLLVGGPIVGFVSSSLKQMAGERDRAERAAAAAAERARLARAVHDGVLQVLALVQRRSLEPDGAAAGERVDLVELGRLAGEQESVLRTLIRTQDAVDPAGGRAGPVRGEAMDLVAGLYALERRPGVSVATPATPVRVPARVADELVAAVAACLDNVTRHVGEGAPAWVLLEAWPERVEVSVRDEGPGIGPGRHEEAAAGGRLGVTQSIRGRVADLGGSARLVTGDDGTEWSLVVPLEGGGR